MIAMALGAAMAASSAVFVAAAASSDLHAAPRASPEFLSDVLRDWRLAKKRGVPDTATRLQLAERAFAVADVARGRERYEALRFVAGLDSAEPSAELLAARDRALTRVVLEFANDGDILGEFLLRVLRRDQHDQDLRARICVASSAPAVRAACEFQPLEPLLERALDDGDITPAQRDALVGGLLHIAKEFGPAKHPLSGKTWGEFADGFARSVRELVLIGEPAPEIHATTADARELRLSQVRGKLVLLCFWGEWCEPSRALYARQRELALRRGNTRFEIVGINSDTQSTTFTAALARERLTWPNIWDGVDGTGGEIATRWRVRAWPTWILIDTGGVVRRRWAGAPEPADLDAALAAWQR